MWRTFLVPAFACVALIFATHHVFSRQQPVTQASPPSAPAASSFASTIAGAGLVEARTENIWIGSHLPGIVAQVHVQVGQRVRPGDALFSLDTRQIDADLEVRRAVVAAAEARLAQLDALPRPEDVPPVEARRRAAEARRAETEDDFERLERLFRQDAVPEQQFVSGRQQLEVARAEFDQARAEEDRLLAGAWNADRAVQAAQLACSRAELAQLEVQKDRHTVRVPAFEAPDGQTTADLEVLQVSVRPGEAVSDGPGGQSLMLGDTAHKHVRVDIDEHDIPRWRSDAPAEGVLRGDGEHRYPLVFVRLEKFVTPKRSLTGGASERVDTRVLQAIYRIDETGCPPVFIGQQLDVFIDIGVAGTPSDAATP